MSLRTLRTILLILAGLLELSLLGLLPSFGPKPLGDVVLLIVVILVLPGLARSYDASGWSKAVYLLSLAFLLFVLFVLAYTMVLWGGDFSLAVRWSRRWLIAGVYFLFISSAVPRYLDWRILRLAILGGALLMAVFILAERASYIDLPGIIIHSQYQGFGWVIKSFNSGNFLLLDALLLSFFYWWAARASMRRILMLGVFAAIFGLVIAFRTWWILGLASIGFTLFLSKFGLGSLRQAVRVLMLSVLVTGLVVAAYSGVHALATTSDAPWAVTVRWVHSAFTALATRTDTVEYRYTVDVSRLVRVWADEDPLYKMLGIGFVATGSTGYMKLGMSSESVDSGWVEVLLTGGVLAALLLLLFWLAQIGRLRKLLQSNWDPIIAGTMSIWLVHGMLMVSHNPLLWDVGFVPLAWAALSGLSYLSQRTYPRGAQIGHRATREPSGWGERGQRAELANMEWPHSPASGWVTP